MSEQPAEPAGWLTSADVLAWTGSQDEATGNGPLGDATAAAAAFVERVRPEYLVTDPVTGEDVYDPPADVMTGALMLAARLYQRRGTALGTAGYSDFGAPELLRQDPDIARLLRIGPHARFAFGAPRTTTTEGGTTS